MKIYLFKEGTRDPVEVEVSPDEIIEGTILPLITENKEATKFISLQNELENIGTSKFKETSVVEKSRLHIHRCQNVVVEVFYNGTIKRGDFSPSSTVSTIFNWAIEKFNISPQDRINFELRFKELTGEILDDDDHIGCFVLYPNCLSRIYLVPKSNPQG